MSNPKDPEESKEPPQIEIRGEVCQDHLKNYNSAQTKLLEEKRKSDSKSITESPERSSKNVTQNINLQIQLLRDRHRKLFSLHSSEPEGTFTASMLEKSEQDSANFDIMADEEKIGKNFTGKLYTNAHKRVISQQILPPRQSWGSDESFQFMS